jgi:hypothetical protein
LGYSGGDVYELLTFVGIVSGLGLDVQAVCGGYTHGWWFLWFSTSWLTTLCKRGTRFSRCLLQVQFLGRVGFLFTWLFVGQRDWGCYEFLWFEVEGPCLGYIWETRIGGSLFMSRFSMRADLG